MDFVNGNKTNSFFTVQLVGMPELLLKGYQFYIDITKNTNNINEKMKKIEENAKNEKYFKIINGLLYGILNDFSNTDLYFQLLYVANKDNFDSFLESLRKLLDENHMNLTPKNFEQIYIIFDKLAHMTNPKLNEILSLICRSFYPGNNLIANCDFFMAFLQFIKSKLNWIIENTTPNDNISGKVFIKILRLLSETHFYQNQPQMDTGIDANQFSETTNNEIIILSKLYSARRNDILKIGRELIRILIQVAKSDIEIINTILEDIAKNNNYFNILSTPFTVRGYDQYVQMNLPPLMESMIVFILARTKKSTASYVKYFNWIEKKFNFDPSNQNAGNAIGYTILIDISRFLITNYFFYTQFPATNELTPRWLLLGYILKITKNELISALIKQAIFFDWICFKKERDHIPLIEPAIQIMYYSAKEFPEITMELIEFIDNYSEYFDKGNKSICKNCVCEAFKEAEARQIIPTLSFVLKEDKISPEIKKIYENLIRFKSYPNPQNNMNNNITNGNYSNQMYQNVMQDTQNVVNNNINVDMKKIIENDNKNDTLIIPKPVGGKEVEKEFFISQNFSSLISPTVMKNFINFKSVKTFNFILDDICKSHLNKTKSKNSLESKLNSIDPSYIELLKQFANFYFNAFKDEILLDFPNNISSPTNVSMYLYEYMFNKMSSNEFSFLADIVNKLIEIYPITLINLMLYITNKNNRKNSTISKICFNFISKVFDYNQKVLKDKMHLFINLCVDNFYLELLNYFFVNGFTIFHFLFIDDEQLIFDIVIYSNIQSINSISINLLYGNFILFDKNFYKIIQYSFDLNSSEQNKLWMLIISQGKIPSSSYSEYIINFVEFSKIIAAKPKGVQDEFFNHFSNGLLNLFKGDLFDISNNKNCFIELWTLFEFNCIYSEYLYGIISMILERFNKSSAEVFYKIIEEYGKRNIENVEKIKNFLNIVNFICFTEKEKISHNKNIMLVLFDNGSFSMKKMNAKIEEIVNKTNLQYK